MKNKGRHAERHSFMERVAHLTHLISLFVLLITGFKIYFGWGFMAYHDAFYLHIIFAVMFIVANWIMIPYNIATTELPHCEMCKTGKHSALKHRVSGIFNRYIFGPADVKKSWQILLNYVGKADYPPITVYDVKNEGYIDKLHPATKFLLPIEGLAVFLIVVTGIVIYDLDWSILGLPISQWLLVIADIVAPIFNMGGIPFMRTIHLLMAYFFIIEVIIHVGIIEFDPKVWKYHKAVFLTGEEDLNDRNYVKLVNAEKER